MSSPKVTKKELPLGEFNTELIFSRVMYLLGNDQLQLSSVFNFELSPVPLSLFSESGDARYPSTKAVLMNTMKCEVSSISIFPSATVIDGVGMLHSSIYWPKEGTVLDLANSVEKFTVKHLQESDVYMVFDRYIDNSIKSDTRLNRIGRFQRSHQLNIRSDLPSKDICMSSQKTKKIIIDIITEHLLAIAAEAKFEQKLMIPSTSKYPENVSLVIK